MQYRLITKLTISYILVTLFTIFLISVFANVLLQKHFKDYVLENQKIENSKIIETLTTQYEMKNSWNMDAIEAIGMSALTNGVIMTVTDINGEIIWDANMHNQMMCKAIIKEMATNMSENYPFLEAEYRVIPYDLIVNDSKIGTVEMGTYGPFYLDKHDLAFINSLNKFLFGVGILSFVFAVILGRFMANRISTPISSAIESARKISKGLYTSRIETVSKTKEMNELTGTLNQMAETLDKQEKLRRRLTSDVSHELRTPLATLNSHMEAMIDGIWEPSTLRLKSCQEEIMRMSKMIKDLENLTQFESENLLLNKTDFELGHFIKRISQNFESDFMSKQIQVEIDVPSKEFMLFADKDKMTQVLINLISNAIKFTPCNGHISMGYKAIGDQIRIFIKDDGIGISKEEQSLIFERFYRTDLSRTRMTGGSGIGLSIVKAIIEAHQGNIEVYSEIGRGTEFVIILENP